VWCCEGREGGKGGEEREGGGEGDEGERRKERERGYPWELCGFALSSVFMRET
jgi:hypothetical protein